MAGTNKRLGNHGEFLAKTYLEKQGHAILAKNFYTRFGELDLISKYKKQIHIIEVKTFKSNHIPIGYKINWKKQRRMAQSTCIFLDRYKLWSNYVQFDLITIHSDQIKHIKNIFSLVDV